MFISEQRFLTVQLTHALESELIKKIKLAFSSFFTSCGVFRPLFNLWGDWKIQKGIIYTFYLGWLGNAHFIAYPSSHFWNQTHIFHEIYISPPLNKFPSRCLKPQILFASRPRVPVSLCAPGGDLVFLTAYLEYKPASSSLLLFRPPSYCLSSLSSANPALTFSPVVPHCPSSPLISTVGLCVTGWGSQSARDGSSNVAIHVCVNILEWLRPHLWVGLTSIRSRKSITVCMFPPSLRVRLLRGPSPPLIYTAHISMQLSHCTSTPHF